MNITPYLELSQLGLALSILFIYLCVYTMRKLMARVSWRIGPKYVGPSGFFQVFADILKFMVKEDIVPDMEPKYMRILYGISPFLLLGLSLAIVTATPIPYLVKGIEELSNALIWVLLLLSLDIVVLIVSTWYVSSKYAFLGSYRALAQMLSYDIVLALSLLAPAIASRSSNISDISRGIHGIWYAILMPIGFVTGLVGILAELEIVPFDIPEAPTEVVGGWGLEYTGPRFLALFLAKRMEGFALMTLLASLYLGGDSGYPPLPHGTWLFVKAFLLALLIVYIVASYPRYSLRGALLRGWKLWVPLAYANFVLALIYALIG
ncbi:NADH-quinone oxidoreductase subunit NuoH [Pyrofollis japonicus]|uniref:complex I subunit 1/NuoH family protein n=1 Tax=Pyrofollis japonicus TaxID=3060460 RepID=UPI00295A627E|nr:complex I subunit 1 family protein [Pyrofollis japonicus]BEP18380.1 NADH-quinone oxidoreductase subunit NuoH [Pyrofollis japonicus]